MRAREFILELGNTQPNYTKPDKQRSGKHVFTTTFQGAEDRRRVDVTFFYNDITVEVDFKLDGWNNSYITGGGDAVKILSAVRHIVAQELPRLLKKIPRLKQVRFRSYAEAGSRVSLYKNRAVPFVSQILGPDWRYYGDYETMGDHWFYWQHRTVTGLERVRVHGMTPQEQPDEPYSDRVERKKKQQPVNEDNDYMAGHCHVMALALKQLHPDWQIRAHIGWDQDAEDDDYRVDHVYVVAPDGAAYDCRGRFDSEQQLVGADETGGEETQLVDMDQAEIDHLVTRHELKPYTQQQIDTAQDIFKRLDEVVIDNDQGAGVVPHNMEVDYFGLRVKMRPSVFLKLSAPLNDFHRSTLMRYIADGGAIASPFLIVDIPPAWDSGDFSEPAQVSQHEGRNRMTAVSKLEGDDAVEVHIFPRYYRNKDMTPKFIENLNRHLGVEDSHRVLTGPLFTM